ncbi:MAG TPA: flavin reductase family protein [bacterium]|nr:flavin reductase family protein [bacterium]
MSVQDAVRRALLTVPNPVAALTVTHERQRNGMIVSWLTPVSVAPPMIAVSIHRERFSHRLIEGAGRFNLTLLREDQKDRVPQFKLKDENREAKFAGLPVATDAYGQPYLTDGVAVLHCLVTDSLATGDHTLFIAEVQDAAVGEGAALCTKSLGKTYSGKK